MELSLWGSLFAICLLGAMSPGPSLAVVVGSTLGSGTAAGYASALAHGVGVALYGLLTVTGLAMVFASSELLFTALQLLGACYLIYLGIKSLRSSAAVVENREHTASPGRGTAASRGFWVAFLNPKLAIFMLALFSQFLGPQTDTLARTVMVATVGITDAGWYCLIVALVSQRAILTRLQRNARLIDRVFGVILILLACSLLLRLLLTPVAAS